MKMLHMLLLLFALAALLLDGTVLRQGDTCFFDALCGSFGKAKGCVRAPGISRSGYSVCGG